MNGLKLWLCVPLVLCVGLLAHIVRGSRCPHPFLIERNVLERVSSGMTEADVAAQLGVPPGAYAVCKEQWDGNTVVIELVPPQWPPAEWVFDNFRVQVWFKDGRVVGFGYKPRTF